MVAATLPSGPIAQKQNTDAYHTVWALLETVTDPEIPVVSLREMGILRAVRESASGLEVVIMQPGAIIGPYDIGTWSQMFTLVRDGKMNAVPDAGLTFAHVHEVVAAHNDVGDLYDDHDLARCLGGSGRSVPGSTMPRGAGAAMIV